ncbi:hypothetical protein [Lysinibacillus sphaericus]|uniref:hypothetical protein n=1 Tax=Lysinibacillus sphaericus TaxID=1421 RepID=UPI00248AEE46|nr:hypothetical protein [Lysinibacillus sphaericus]
MLWLVYEDYFEQNGNMNFFVRYLKWYVWVIFLLLLAVTLFFFYKLFHTQNGWYFVIECVFAVLSGGYFGYEVRKSVISNIGDKTDVFEHSIISMRNALEQRKIDNIEQIDLLINQINEEISELKLSDKFRKSVYTISTVLLVPSISLISKWLLDSYDEGIYMVVMVLAVVMMLIGLFYIIKPLLEAVIDSPYKKLKILKRTLEDVKMLDYLK